MCLAVSQLLHFTNYIVSIELDLRAKVLRMIYVLKTRPMQERNQNNFLNFDFLPILSKNYQV